MVHQGSPETRRNRDLRVPRPTAELPSPRLHSGSSVGTGEAVSYTHLDVYKRQVQDLDRKRCQELGVPSLCYYEGFTGRCQPRGQTGSKKAIGDTNLAATGPGAVSYSGNARNYSFDRCRNFGCQRHVCLLYTSRCV